MNKVPTWKKLTAGAVLSTGLFAAGEALSHTDMAPEVASSSKDLGKVALVGEVILLAGAGLRWSAADLEKTRRQEQARRERLPKLEPGLTTYNLYHRYKNLDDDKFDYGAAISTGLTIRMHAQAFGFQLSSSGTAEVFNAIVDDLVDDRIKSVAIRGTDAGKQMIADIIEECHLLDEIAPIDPNCPNTPPSGEPGKFWFDYIDKMARPEAETSPAF